mgnify:CR=1 FL=1
MPGTTRRGHHASKVCYKAKWLKKRLTWQLQSGWLMLASFLMQWILHSTSKYLVLLVLWSWLQSFKFLWYAGQLLTKLLSKLRILLTVFIQLERNWCIMMVDGWNWLAKKNPYQLFNLLPKKNCILNQLMPLML